MHEHFSTDILVYNVGFNIKVVLHYDYPQMLMHYPGVELDIRNGNTYYGTCNITETSFVYNISDDLRQYMTHLSELIAFG